MEPIYLIFGGFLALNLAVGLYYGRNVKTLREYAVGHQDFPILVVTATIVATWVGGSGFIIILNNVYSQGFGWLITLPSSVIAVFIVGLWSLRMGEFKNHLSIAGAMGSVYGNSIRLVSACLGIFRSILAVAAQFKLGSEIIQEIFGVKPFLAIALVAGIVIIYSSFGGIRSVMVTDLFQLGIFCLLIPLLIFLFASKPEVNQGILPALQSDIFSLKAFLNNPTRLKTCLFFCLFYLIPGFSPTTYQRCILNTPRKIKKAYQLAAIIYFFIVFSIGAFSVLLFVDSKGLEPEKLLTHILQAVKFGWFKGLFLVWLVTLIMSRSDSYLNASGVIFANDILKPMTRGSNVTSARVFCAITGIISTLAALFFTNALEIVLLGGSIYGTMILVPFYLMLLGFRTGHRAILSGMFTSLAVSIFYLIYYKKIQPSSILLAMFINGITVFFVHYLLKETRGWVGIKDKAPLLADRQIRKRRWMRFRKALRSFRLGAYLQKALPKQAYMYPLFGVYVLFFVFSQSFLSPYLSLNDNLFVFLLISCLVLNALITVYPIWPRGIKKKCFIAPLWFFGVGYILFFVSPMLLLIGRFPSLHLLIANLTIGLLLFFARDLLLLAGLGSLATWFVFTHYALGENNVAFWDNLSPLQLVYNIFLVATCLIAIFKSKKQMFKLQEKKIRLQKLQKSAEDTLSQMKAAPDYFVQKIIQTNHAGIPSAYARSKALQDRLNNAKTAADVRLLQKEATQLTQQIEKSASYLEKTIYAIETQTQLQKERVVLSEFLDKLYDRLPDIEEGALLLSNQSKAKTIQWDVHKIYGLLHKTYEQIRLQNPAQAYFYLHIQDTTLRYPNHTKPIPALAFLITKSEQSTPAIASSYTHLDKISIDPHLAGNPYFREAQIQVDKHYGYLGLAKVPNEYLIVLPARIDDIRPELIEDEAAPGRSLDSELMREAKQIEAGFWQAITQKPHYNVVEIEHVVNFMKATHQHQTRKSGHPYYTHTLSVAKYASEHSKAPDIVIAALLHDIVEDTGITLEEVGVRFGAKVEKLVRLLSNIKGTFKKYTLDSKKAHVALLAEEKEAILIKACDRLHNLQTLGAMPRHKQQAKAAETLEYYTPVIRAAGFARLADQLEEIATKFVE